MKIAIADNKNGFTKRWIDYCTVNHIDYKIVNCYSTNIIHDLQGCGALMWHFHHLSPKDILCAKQILYSVQEMGIKVFPDFNTMWHFDDKVGQKYLLEAMDAPLVPSYVFYSKHDALEWVSNTTFPKVFKLRGGAGSSNVKLIKTRKKAFKIVKQAFEKGFSKYNRWMSLKDRIYKYRKRKANLSNILRCIVGLFFTTDFARIAGCDKGYVYFQDFMPNNKFDIRIIVVGNKAFGIKRVVRDNDFRASGSGDLIHRKSEIDERCVKIAFEINDKLKSQSIAYDFIFDENDKPLIVEVSYGYTPEGYNDCEGYWNKDLSWCEGKIDPYGWMIENIMIQEK